VRDLAQQLLFGLLGAVGKIGATLPKENNSLR
jgi:hypothetical protein